MASERGTFLKQLVCLTTCLKNCVWPQNALSRGTQEAQTSLSVEDSAPNNDVLGAVEHQGRVLGTFVCAQKFCPQDRQWTHLCVLEQPQALQCLLSPTVFAMPFHPQAPGAQL